MFREGGCPVSWAWRDGGRRGKPRLYGKLFTIEKADTRSALESYRNHQKLLRRHQRMRDGMDGEGDAVLYSDFAHQFCDVSFHGTLLDAEG